MYPGTTAYPGTTGSDGFTQTDRDALTALANAVAACATTTQINALIADLNAKSIVLPTGKTVATNEDTNTALTAVATAVTGAQTAATTAATKADAAATAAVAASAAAATAATAAGAVQTKIAPLVIDGAGKVTTSNPALTTSGPDAPTIAAALLTLQLQRQAFRQTGATVAAVGHIAGQSADGSAGYTDVALDASNPPIVIAQSNLIAGTPTTGVNTFTVGQVL